MRFFLHLSYEIGASLFSISVDEENSLKTQNLSVSITTGIPQQTVVIDNCTILTMETDQLINEGRIIIQVTSNKRNHN